MTVLLDLMSPDDRELSLSVPPGQFFDVRLVNLAPSSVYRVTADWLRAPTSPKPPERALHQTYELSPPAPSQLRPLPFGPPCDDLQRQVLELLRATEEAEVAPRLTSLEGLELPDACDFHIQSLLEKARPRLKTTYSLLAGDRLVVTVDRLDDSRGVQRTWRAVVRPEGPPERQWASRTEEQWVVASVVLDLTEMVRFASERRLPEPSQILLELSEDLAAPVTAYRVEIDTGRGGRLSRTVVLEDHLWSPRAFEGLARSLLVLARLQPAKRRDRADVLKNLLTPTASVIREESRRVSGRLERSMTDAEAHAEAALILGALALREPASAFADTRPALNRMAVHLALARALSEVRAPSPQRAMAEAVLATLVGRQREALDRLEVIEVNRPSGPERAWARALHMRNTRDWRVLEEPEEASLLERLSYFRAALRAVGRASALAFLDRSRPEPVPDWGWLALGYFPDVGTGNRYAGSTDRMTREELAAAWEEESGDPLEPGSTTRVLNERAAGCIERGSGETPSRLRVVGWGLWAEFYQRQLLSTALCAEHHLRHMLAVDEAAAAYRGEVSGELGELRLFPAVQHRWTAALVGDTADGWPPPSTSEDEVAAPVDEETCESFASVIRESPEVGTFSNWEFMQRMCARARDTSTLPPLREWFRPGLPVGTSYGSRARFNAWDQLRQQAPTPESLRRIAPYSWPVLDYVVNSRFGNAPSPEDLISILGPLTEYDITAMRWISRRGVGDVSVHTRWLGKMAELDPDEYVRLARYLAHREIDDRAAAAYEKAIARARDRVAVSNNLGWLMDYYFERGQIEDAIRVANEAASTGSGGGLRTMARALERMGQPRDAERWYRRVADRYDRKEPLQRFHIRHARRYRDDLFATAAAEALTALFPEGLEAFSPDTISAEPGPEESYVLSTYDFDERLRRFGLRIGDRIVALDGHRVRNEQQYLAVRSFRDDPTMTAVVWRDGRLETVSGRYRRYRYDRVY
jgi:tetratricopeptide (TPR) repeat protein